MRRLAISLAILLAAPATAAAPVKLTKGKTKIDIDREFGLKLLQAGVDAAPVAPATQDGVTFTLPISGGRVRGTRATINHDGGMDLANVAEGTDLKQTELRFVFRDRKFTLSAFQAIKGQGYDRFAFATGTARVVKRTPSGFTAKGVELKLNDIGATALNSQMRTDVFKEGEAFGTATVRARR